VGTKDWVATAREVGAILGERAEEHDVHDRFVAENYVLLKDERFFSAAIPAELGGGGATHSEMCRVLRELAHHCSSTALALSMHQHLVAAAVWRHRHGQPAEALLRRIAENQLVLISTGASDWLESSGSLERVDGGYRLSARKPFASGSPAGDLLVTSAPWDDPQEGPLVLHFAVPFDSEGVTVMDNWRTYGMRGTGSNDVLLENVFVPDAAIALRRPRGTFHPSWAVVLTVALPLIMSVYVGIAERAASIAIDRAGRRKGDPDAPQLVGEMVNHLTVAQLAVDDLVANAADLDFSPETERANAALIARRSPRRRPSPR
jgi:alkylation response protein AidB-like acyl-CoA dehydrogenase